MDTEVIVRSGISVLNDGEDARAVFVEPTSSTPFGDSLKMVTNQLLQAPTATDMVATDVRTPPRVKSQHRKEDLPIVGKGEATPIEIDEKNVVEQPSTTQKTNNTPSPEGISTWILLSNGEQSTLATSKKKPSQPTSTSIPEKKYSASISTTTERVTLEKTVQNNKVSQFTLKKQNVTKEEHTKVPIITLHDSKFKNRTPITVGRVPPVPKNKTLVSSTKKTTTQIPTSLSENTTIKKKVSTITPATTVSLTSVKGTFLPEVVPTTSLVIETDTIESADESTTTETPSTTTKRTRRPGNKKKKNKNRRRRPTKTDSTKLESKITPENSINNNSKIEGSPNRPLSTRIYNYLAREVMPNVGVGIVGLVLTAGLAGLLLYPFGGGIARRNDYKAPGSTPDGHMYYYNDYSPNSDVDQGNVQSEETVFGQVLSGMKHNSYSNSYESPNYNNKYRYESHDYNSGNVNGYAGVGEYSTIPESIKNADYSTLPDSTKYSYSMEHISPQYKTSETSLELDKYNVDESKYPSLTEYTAYTDAESVGTSGKFESLPDETKTDISEDKSDKSQPQFSPLVGSPHFNDFVGSVSVSGSYGTEVHHRTGAMASEHGPRSLKLKKREKRDTINSNEIDIGSNISQGTKSEIQIQNTEYDSTPTNMPETSTIKVTEPSNIETTASAVSSVTEKEKEVTTPCPEVTTMKNKTEEFSFVELLRGLAQAKLKLGINLLRVTSETFQNYLNHLTMKMETAVRHLDKKASNTTMAAPPHMVRRRNKRELKKQHKKKYIPNKHKKEKF